MIWNGFIQPIRQSGICRDAAWKILKKLFEKAGCVIADIPESTLQSWIKNGRHSRVNTYFPAGEIDSMTVFHYFRSRQDEKLYALQSIFENQVPPESDCPIDVKTKDLDIFCWSLVNQFLDLLELERIDIPQPEGDTFHVRKPPAPHDQKCCLYCVHWKGDRSAVGISTISTDGMCHIVYSANRHKLTSRPSSTAAYTNYRADLKLMDRMKESGYDIQDFNDMQHESVMSECQRQFEIVRKRRRNFVVFRRGG